MAVRIRWGLDTKSTKTNYVGCLGFTRLRPEEDFLGKNLTFLNSKLPNSKTKQKNSFFYKQFVLEWRVVHTAPTSRML